MLVRELRVMQAGLGSLGLERVQIVGDRATLQMPFLEHDLMGLAMARVRFDVHETWLLFREIVAQIGRLHSKGLVHRDVKSSNVLVGRVGQPHVVDFGHCVPESRVSAFSQCGTMIYLAPELLLSRVTKKSHAHANKGDMWSLGCLLAELLLGFPLFLRCKTPLDMAKAFEMFFGEHKFADRLRCALSASNSLPSKTSRKVSVRQLILRKSPDADACLLDLLEKLLSPDPESRPSCEEVLELLQKSDEFWQDSRKKVQVRLGKLEVNCHEHEVRKRLIAKKRKLGEKGKCKGKRDARDLARKAGCSGEESDVCLKRVKT